MEIGGKKLVGWDGMGWDVVVVMREELVGEYER